MKWLWVFLCLASPGLAQTVVVASGEHGTYSRLVLPLPEGTDWQLGRTAAGYELALSGGDLRFDLSDVFDLIPKARLTGIFADPATGRLQLALSCVCHAMPFQLDARTLVIDLRDGPAPPASSFELALDGSNVPPLVQSRQPRPRARPDVAMAKPGQSMAMPVGAGYDWLAARAPDHMQTATPMPAAGPVRPSGTDLQPLRETLIRQLSRGAADGVIDLALPEGRKDSVGIPENPQLRVTDAPGMIVQTERAAPDVLQPDGMDCLSDMTLDLSAWGQEGDTPAQIAAARAALVGEFDKPDQAAVAQSVRHHLYLGFGAEAEMAIGSFGATDPDVPVWIAIARIMDGRRQTENVFAAMAGCDTAAALWSVLAAAPADPLDGVNIPAVRRAFSALPAHLRLHLAPQLAERATAMGEDTLARAVTVATNRATATPMGGQVVLQARTDLAEGRFAEVIGAMEAVLAGGGPMVADAVILLVEAKIAVAEPISADIPGVAAALLPEHEGTDMAPALMRAWQVSMAASGDFDGAFAAGPDGTTMADIWHLLARLGTDEAVLAHAILPPGTNAFAERETAVRLAERLLDLGFADAAADWADLMGPEVTDADKTLLARIALAQGNGRAVLATLAGQTAPEALILKAQAEQALGQPALARLTWAAAGDAVASARAAGWAQSWTDVAQGAEGPWQAAAEGVVNTRQPAAGPLENGQALVDESAAMRASLTALLASVPQP